jgi:acyl-CoA thioesterase-1
MKQGLLFFSGLFLLAGLVWPGATPFLFAEDTDTRILFIGDSITAGLGVEPEHSYPALIDHLLKEKGFEGVRITNGSISGSTTAGALSRLKWYLRAKPDILVLALGANDGLRGLSTVEMARNLDNTIGLAREKGIRVILAGMEIPPNYGPEYAKAFREVFVALADKHPITLVPFLLKDVAGKASLNQADGIHPNRAGHEIIAATVLPYLVEQL